MLKNKKIITLIKTNYILWLLTIYNKVFSNTYMIILLLLLYSQLCRTLFQDYSLEIIQQNIGVDINIEIETSYWNEYLLKNSNINEKSNTNEKSWVQVMWGPFTAISTTLILYLFNSIINGYNDTYFVLNNDDTPPDSPTLTPLDSPSLTPTNTPTPPSTPSTPTPSSTPTPPGTPTPPDSLIFTPTENNKDNRALYEELLKLSINKQALKISKHLCMEVHNQTEALNIVIYEDLKRIVSDIIFNDVTRQLWTVCGNKKDLTTSLSNQIIEFNTNIGDDLKVPQTCSIIAHINAHITIIANSALLNLDPRVIINNEEGYNFIYNQYYIKMMG